ncbi:phage head morphogenesis protein [Rheinheimera sp. 4Y26]|uniref:phage head morphogenesis protein n=1 Tax=Rheinheimera sp. 4Y26 TaxID=2977811 RepID=UPI0021B1276B|nr:phage head morphogenesis protein [Rheinheimera sp. 4Y26]MCT6700912.1 phage head morphogenesis protein [Rheinheimera sp. 4Y26]
MAAVKPTAHYGSLPFKEAIAYFRAKLNLPSERWADVWREQHDAAFMVAGAMKSDLLADLRQAVDAAIAEGRSLKWFQSEFKNIVKRTGWEHNGDAAWRARVIYDTNMRQAYNAGRYQQLQQFEFWRYVHGDSRYPRPDHQKHHNLVLPKTAAFWQIWFPQNGWGCKCKVIGETKQSIERKGLKVSNEPEIPMRDWVDKKTGEVHQVPKGIDPGFDYAPGASKPSEQIKQQLADKQPLAERLPERLAPSAFSTVPGVNIHRLNEKLTELAATSAGPQVQQLSQFLHKHDIKTLFITQAQMNPKAIAPTKILSDVNDYLDAKTEFHPLQRLTTKGYLYANGFTSRSFNHVVVKTNAGNALSRAAINEMRRAVDLAIINKQSDKAAWTLSDIIRKQVTDGSDGAVLSDWLHEMGHQLHYKTGLAKSGISDWVTVYSTENFKEWHAEHFVMWLLNRKALAAWREDVALYFDQLMKQALN